MDIEENNKLIAEFMGLKEDITFSEPFGNPMYEVDGKITNLRYNFSWDWLMPVVEKIENMGHNFDINNWSTITINYSNLNFLTSRKNFHNKKDTKFENTYNVIIKFIEWYNKNK